MMEKRSTCNLVIDVSLTGQPWTWPLLPQQWSRVLSAAPLSPTPCLPPSSPVPPVSPATPASPVRVSALTHHTWQLHNNWVSAPPVTDSSDVLMIMLTLCINVMNSYKHSNGILWNDSVVFYECLGLVNMFAVSSPQLKPSPVLLCTVLPPPSLHIPVSSAPNVRSV